MSHLTMEVGLECGVVGIGETLDNMEPEDVAGDPVVDCSGDEEVACAR